MRLPRGTKVAIVDGTQFSLFENNGMADEPMLTVCEVPELELTNRSGGNRHRVTSRNPAFERLDEDAHAAAVADWLNHQAITNAIDDLVIVADPRTLGEMRLHYHKELKDRLRADLPLTLTGMSRGEIADVLTTA